MCHPFLLTWLYVIYFVEAEGDPEKYRFQVELEFVQCLANPNYLNCKLGNNVCV